MWKVLIIILCIFLAGCSSAIESTPTDYIPEEVQKPVLPVSGELKQPDPVVEENKPREQNRIFQYQLRGADYELLLDLDVDAFILDIDHSDFQPWQIKELGKDGAIVLSYLSIGDADFYRSYWKRSWRIGDPFFILGKDPLIKGKYDVQFWIPQWQNVMLDQVENIILQGYDGVYLEGIDAYKDFPERKTGKEEMMRFVRNIANSAEQKNPEFLIFAQNSVELLEDDFYAEALDGLVLEDTWFAGNTRRDPTIKLRYAKVMQDQGKMVLAIDYPTNKEYTCEFYTQCQEAGFICTVSTRELDLDVPIVC